MSPVAQSVAAEEAQARIWAANFLRQHGRSAAAIVDVHADAILFRETAGAFAGPWTGWLRWHPDRATEIRFEPGFPAEPGPGVWGDAPRWLRDLRA